MTDYTLPRYFAPGSIELAQYIAEGERAGYDMRVEEWRKVTGTPAPPPLLLPKSLGVDVSHWNGNRINWQAVASGGYKFMYAKACENSRIDTTFAANWLGAKPTRISRGAYMFFRPDKAPDTQTRFFMQLLDENGRGELTPSVDVEPASYLPAPDFALWLNRLVVCVELLTNYLGRPPVIYTNGAALDTLFNWRNLPTLPQAVTACPLWVAHHKDPLRGEPILPRGWTKYALWQFDNGGYSWSVPVPGIPGRCDRNLWGTP